MFGYVNVNRETLSPENEARFRAYYCGLCRALRKRHGLTGTLTLSNDMTFLAMVLSGLYEPEEQSGREICVAHPLKKHDWVATEATDYAADMNVMLAYHLCMDDWRDEKKPLSLAEAGLVRRGYQRVKARYPEKCEFIADMIAALSDLEKKGPDGDIDAPTNLTGELIGELFAWREDEWKAPLTRMGAALGRFIYLMDAYDDLDKDAKKGRFNALRQLADELPPAAYEQRCHELLTLQMGRCAQQFEMLPILKDTPEGKLLYNTIYSGVWSKYALVRKHREARRHD